MEATDVIKRLDRIERLVGSPALKGKYWVRASVIMELTGWNKAKMDTARKNGYVDYQDRKSAGLFYDLNSLHPLLLKK